MAKSLVPEPTLTSYPDAQENEGEEEEMTEKKTKYLYIKTGKRERKNSYQLHPSPG